MRYISAINLSNLVFQLTAPIIKPVFRLDRLLVGAQGAPRCGYLILLQFIQGLGWRSNLSSISSWALQGIGILISQGILDWEILVIEALHPLVFKPIAHLIFTIRLARNDALWRLDDWRWALRLQNQVWYQLPPVCGVDPWLLTFGTITPAAWDPKRRRPSTLQSIKWWIKLISLIRSMPMSLKFEVLIINLSWTVMCLGTLNCILYGFHLISKQDWVDRYLCYSRIRSRKGAERAECHGMGAPVLRWLIICLLRSVNIESFGAVVLVTTNWIMELQFFLRVELIKFLILQLS